MGWDFTGPYFAASQGWQCPVCKYVYSPMTPGCYHCNRPDNEKFKVSTGAGEWPPCTCGTTARCLKHTPDATVTYVENETK